MSPILAGARQVAFIDVDDTIRETHGYAKQGVAYGYSKVKGDKCADRHDQHPGLGAGDRRRQATQRQHRSAHGAGKLISEALATLRRTVGVPELQVVRADSAYYRRDVVAAATRAGARFSITARLNPSVTRAIAAIPEDAWVAIRYPNAIYDQEQQRWIWRR